jgi:hypothetical protein
VSKRTAPSVFVTCVPRRNVSPSPASKPEYTPPASQCQMSTTALSIGSHEPAARTRSARPSGTPSRPSRMSRRTDPASK